MDMNINTNSNNQKEIKKVYNEKKKSYRKICTKVGFSISVFLICRTLCSLISTLVYRAFPDLGDTAFYAISAVLSCIFVYFIPLLFTIMIFNAEELYFGKFKVLYKKPEKSARVFAAFPAVYGLGMSVNILTLIVFYLISTFNSNGVDVEKSFQTAGMQVPDNIYSALIMAFLMVVIAPIFEEFWVRGILYDALKPYGHGISILITSVVFGFMHGSLQMLFYTTAIGFALGYVRYATGSIFACTIMHAGINFISALIMTFMSTDIFKKISTFQETSSSEDFLVMMFYVYIGIVILLALIGIISFFKRLPAIKRNKIKNNCPEIKPFRKFMLFLTCLPVVLMFVLAIDGFLGQVVAQNIMKLFYK